MGETVLVAPGVYDGRIDFKGKDITVKSSAGVNLTFIDGRFSTNEVPAVVAFVNGEGASSKPIGFTIRNGRGASTHGGGIRIWHGSSPTISETELVSTNIIYTMPGELVFAAQSNVPINASVHRTL